MGRKRRYDSIVVSIPVNVTADLGIAMRRCREKRIRKLKEKHPSLFEKNGEDEKKEKNGKENKFDARKSSIRREDYGSVLDYLEAKYARGVISTDDLDKKLQRDSKNGDGSSNDSSVEDGARSTYSDGSGFIDDAQLRTGIAEQMIASCQSVGGTTKVEAEARKKMDEDLDVYCNDDTSFFVNIGDLEMEDGFNENAANIDFDALHKMEQNSAKKKKKKQKTQKSSSTLTSSNKTKNKSITTPKKSKSNTSKQMQDTHSLSSISSSLPSSNKPSSFSQKNSSRKSTTSNSSTKKLSPKVQALKDNAELLKSEQLRYYKKALHEIKMLTEDHLPRKLTTNENIKVSIKVPQGKSPGDFISFTNPRISGQRLRVKIPDNYHAGSKFHVTVPTRSSEETKQSNSSSNAIDANNFPRDCKDVLDDYSRAYDEWIDAESRFRDNIPSNDRYKPSNEKMKKFDKLLDYFPTELVTPIDAAYLRKVVRRARQNSMKRKISLDRKKLEDANTPDDKLIIPQRGTNFSRIQFQICDFERQCVSKYFTLHYVTINNY